MANGYTRQVGAKRGRATKVKINCGGYKKDGRKKIPNNVGRRGKTKGY